MATPSRTKGVALFNVHRLRTFVTILRIPPPAIWYFPDYSLHLYKTNRNVYGRSNQAQCCRPIQQDVRSRNPASAGQRSRFVRSHRISQAFHLELWRIRPFPQKHQMRRHTLWKTVLRLPGRHGNQLRPGPGDRGQHAGRYAAQRLRPAVPPRPDKRHLAGTGNKAVFLLFLFLYRGTAFVRRRERNLPRLSEED